MPYSHPATPATHFHLDEDAWAEIGAAYRAGASALSLAIKWKVSRGTIYINMKKRGWSKKRDGAAFARATHPAPAPVASPSVEVVQPETLPAGAPPSFPDGNPGFHPDPRYMIERYTAGEVFEPGVVAQIAASASGGAMMTGQYADAYVLAQIALVHAKIVKLRPMSLRAALLELMQNRAMADELFSFTRRDGEEDEKRAYWSLQQARDRELADGRAAIARVAALEERLRALGAEV